MTELRIAVIGGGSGGHLFPAIAVIQELLRQNASLQALFLVSQRIIDQSILASAGWPDERVQVKPYVSLKSGNRVTRQFAMIPSAFGAIRVAKRAISNFQPNVAVGLGAFASVPGVIAASRMKIPVALMEQDIIPGKATRVLSKRAAVTIAGLPFEQRFAARWPSRLEVIGTPVRREISQLAESPLQQKPGPPRLLILGGSQGAHNVNRLVLEVLADEQSLPSDWEVVHQTGEADAAAIDYQYSRLRRSVRVIPFLHDMPSELARASIVISRAGAVTLQEIACAGIPAILIPLSSAMNQHQMRNARFVAASDGTLVVDESEIHAADHLKGLLKVLVAQPSLRERLSTGVRKLSRPNAASHAAHLICSVAERP